MRRSKYLAQFEDWVASHLPFFRPKPTLDRPIIDRRSRNQQELRAVDLGFRVIGSQGVIYVDDIGTWTHIHAETPSSPNSATPGEVD